jgi:tetratricopeptide (TPR) repeat protein
MEMMKKHREHLLLLLCFVLICGLLLITLARNEFYRTPVALLQDAVLKSPKKYRPHYNLGTRLKDAGDLDAARNEWEKTLALEPRHSEALNQLGNYWLLKGFVGTAENYYARAVESLPSNAEALYNYAMTLEAGGKTDQAVEYYERFLALAPPEYESELSQVRWKLNMLRNTKRR